MNTVIDHRYFLNRELSWLAFNERVLEEAVDPQNPLLEQLNFVAIASSNLDEFFMIRVAGLMHQRAGGIVRRDNANMTPAEQLAAIAKRNQGLVAKQYRYLQRILTDLEAEGIRFRRPQNLLPEQVDWLERYFRRQIYPVVTPLAVDSSHPFPFLVSRSLNLAVWLQKEGEDTHRTAILPVPGVLSRVIEIPETCTPEGVRDFILLEDVLCHFASEFFQGYEIKETSAFRITRDADLDIDEEGAEDLLVEVEKSLKMRRRGAAVRIEIAAGMGELLRDFILRSLHLGMEDVYEIHGILDATIFFQFISQVNEPRLRYVPVRPHTPAAFRGWEGNIFDAIREQDRFVHLPYESFDPVERFVSEAAKDPQVLAIKQTLYRVSSDSLIVKSLAKAAENGKQVTVLMEVKARFDEENNIFMGRRLEQAGAHVVYGLVGLKTHSKCTLVIRKEGDRIRRYVHVGTGNYNGKTAKLYTDVGLFTANDQFGIDASAFFNLLSGYSDPPKWNKFIVAPMDLRARSLDLIQREIENARRGEKAAMIVKMNSLLDREIVMRLYEASRAGVEIDLIIRGICVLKPGIPGVSEHIRVRSIVGRFLEHARIFWFYNGGNEETYISSADWMPRNLNDRVELMVPVEEESHCMRLKHILEKELENNQKAHVMEPDGMYMKVVAVDRPVNSQRYFQELAERGDQEERLSLRQRLEPFYADSLE